MALMTSVVCAQADRLVVCLAAGDLIAVDRFDFVLFNVISNHWVCKCIHMQIHIYVGV